MRFSPRGGHWHHPTIGCRPGESQGTWTQEGVYGCRLTYRRPKISSRITTIAMRPLTQTTGERPRLAEGGAAGVGAGGGGAAGAAAEAAGAAPAETISANLPKNWSAICLEVPSIRREPICASLPPTAALAV